MRTQSSPPLPPLAVPVWYRGAAGLALAGLLVLAGHFYLERIAYLDLAYHVVTYLRTNHLFVQNQRFGSALTQLVPLLALRAGLPLDAVLRLYSLTFPLLAVAVFAISAYGLRNDRAALAVPLLGTVLVSHLFYWAQSELQQALLWLLLYWALLSSTAHVGLNGRSAVLAALIPVLIYFHPLLLIVFGFVWGYDWLLHPARRRQWLNYGLLLAAAVLYRWRVAHIPEGSYDSQRMDVDALKERLPHVFSLPSTTHFAELLTGELVLLPVLLLVLTAFYVRAARQQPLALVRLAWVAAFVGGYALLVCAAYPAAGEPTYLSNLYQPLALFVVVPFTAEVLPATGRPARGAALALGVLFGVRLLLIGLASAPFTAYQRYLEGLLVYTRQFPESRFIAAEADQQPTPARAPSWAASYETLLLSARHGPDSARAILLTPDVAAYQGSLGSDSLLVLLWDVTPLRELPARYLRPRPSPTRLLTTPPPADTAALRALLLTVGGRSQVALAQPLPAAVPPNTDVVVPVRLTVPAGSRIPAGRAAPHPTALTYCFWRGDWPQLFYTPHPTPLALDVSGAWQQEMTVRTPRQPGTYTLEISLTSQGFADWPAPRLRVPVVVR